MLPLPEQAYLEQTATTAQDLQTLAPVVPEQVRAQVEAADNGLDGDLADWQDGTSTRAKVVLLGPVTVTPGRGNQAADVVENHRDRRLPDHPAPWGEHRRVRHRPLAG